jgi:hypothetical protein
MAKITIDGKEYELDEFSDEAKAQLASIRATDMEIEHLKMLLAIAQTARAAYGRALQDSLPKE